MERECGGTGVEGLSLQEKVNSRTLVPVQVPYSTLRFGMFQVELGLFGGHVPLQATRRSKWNMAVLGGRGRCLWGAQTLRRTALT